MGRTHSYRLQFWLSCIPLAGFPIVLAMAWLRLYRVLKKKRYIVLHWLLMLPCLIVSGTVLYVLIYFLIAPIVSVGLRLALMLALCYVACVVWALCAVLIERALIRRYAEREAESELL